MHLSIAIHVHGVKEASNLLMIREVVSEELTSMLESYISVVFLVNLEEDLPEPFSIILTNIAPVGYDVLNALSELEGPCVVLETLKSVQRD